MVCLYADENDPQEVKNGAGEEERGWLERCPSRGRGMGSSAQNRCMRE